MRRSAGSAIRPRWRCWSRASSCSCSPSSASASISRPARRPASSLDLVFVSPKSGRAVSRAAGAAWRDRLLALPAFLGEEEGPPPSADDLAAAFALTGFFLERHLYAPHGAALPDARAAFIAAVTRAIARVA